ncbi:MAG: leucine-rich repeat domain-containing protein [Clostridia bacterium]|nr:leucine-rich repeat domain-containing protein [Clostridia bacterium]
MKKLQCELCGSVDIMKIDDNVFQCQHCGCKYTQDEVKKILFGEVTFKAQDFEVVGGKLIKYNGESTEVVIPDNVTVIGTKAFENCSGITSVLIPNSVTQIERAFPGCTSIKEIVIPDSVTFIGFGCFDGCSALKEIVIPNSVTTLDGEVFRGCNSLQRVQLSSNLKRINLRTFNNCKSLEEIVIPEGVKEIDASAFEGCDKLKKITLPYSLELINRENDRSRSKSSWPTTLTYIDGNSKPFYDYFRLNENSDLLLSPSDGHKNYVADWYPQAVRLYAEQIRTQRRAMNRCESCGGRFKGIIIKECKKCGIRKTY